MTVPLCPDNIAHSYNTLGYTVSSEGRRIVPQKHALLSQALLNASHEPSSFKGIDCDPKIQLVIEVQEIIVRKPSGLRHWESLSAQNYAIISGSVLASYLKPSRSEVKKSFSGSFLKGGLFKWVQWVSAAASHSAGDALCVQRCIFSTSFQLPSVPENRALWLLWVPF